MGYFLTKFVFSSALTANTQIIKLENAIHFAHSIHYSNSLITQQISAWTYAQVLQITLHRIILLLVFSLALLQCSQTTQQEDVLIIVPWVLIKHSLIRYPSSVCLCALLAHLCRIQPELVWLIAHKDLLIRRLNFVLPCARIIIMVICQQDNAWVYVLMLLFNYMRKTTLICVSLHAN